MPELRISEEEREVLLAVLGEYAPRDEVGRLISRDHEKMLWRRAAIAADLRDRIRMQT